MTSQMPPNNTYQPSVMQIFIIFTFNILSDFRAPHFDGWYCRLLRMRGNIIYDHWFETLNWSTYLFLKFIFRLKIEVEYILQVFIATLLRIKLYLFNIMLSLLWQELILAFLVSVLKGPGLFKCNIYWMGDIIFLQVVGLGRGGH